MSYEQKIQLALRELSKIWQTIIRYHNGILTKKQKRSTQYSTQYWKKVQNVDAGYSLKENEKIFNSYDFTKNNNTRGKIIDSDTIKVRHIGLICFKTVKEGYESMEKVLKHDKLHFNSTIGNSYNKFLFSKLKPFDLTISDTRFYTDTKIENIKTLNISNCVIISNYGHGNNIKDVVECILKKNPSIQKLSLSKLSVTYNEPYGYIDNKICEEYPPFDDRVTTDKTFTKIIYDHD